MNKTISMTAWRRPEYTRRVLESIAKARWPGWRIYPSVDSTDIEMRQIFQGFEQVINLAYLSHHPPFGCDTNTFRALTMAFGFGSDFNLHLEDDTVLSPDALDLCEWFSEHGGDYAALLLHSRSLGGDNPTALREINRFCPWGWTVTRESWERNFAPEWNAKKNQPKGWDWSMGLTVQKHGLKCLQPMLSRVTNIGREGGTYETPEHWDEWTKGLVASDRLSTPNFEIVERLPENYPDHIEPWVKEAVI